MRFFGRSSSVSTPVSVAPASTFNLFAPVEAEVATDGSAAPLGQPDEIEAVVEDEEEPLPQEGDDHLVIEYDPYAIDVKLTRRMSELERAAMSGDNRDLVVFGGLELQRRFRRMNGTVFTVGNAAKPYGWIALELTKADARTGIVRLAFDPYDPAHDVGWELLFTQVTDAARKLGLTRLYTTTFADSETEAYLMQRGWTLADFPEYVIRRLELLKTFERRQRIEEDTKEKYGAGYQILRVKDDARTATDLKDAPASGLGGGTGTTPVLKEIGELVEKPDHRPSGAYTSVFDLDTMDGTEDKEAPEGATLFKVVAQHVESGEHVGFTEILVYEDMPEFGLSGDLWVASSHRGQRLGVLMKNEVLRYVSAERTKVRVVQSRTAVLDTYMLAVHDRLGGRGAGVRRDLELDL